MVVISSASWFYCREDEGIVLALRTGKGRGDEQR
jgi:hypothetical protein